MPEMDLSAMQPDTPQNPEEVKKKENVQPPTQPEAVLEEQTQEDNVSKKPPQEKIINDNESPDSNNDDDEKPEGDEKDKDRDDLKQPETPADAFTPPVFEQPNPQQSKDQLADKNEPAANRSILKSIGNTLLDGVKTVVGMVQVAFVRIFAGKEMAQKVAQNIFGKDQQQEDARKDNQKTTQENPKKDEKKPEHDVKKKDAKSKHEEKYHDFSISIVCRGDVDGLVRGGNSYEMIINGRAQNGQMITATFTATSLEALRQAAYKTVDTLDLTTEKMDEKAATDKINDVLNEHNGVELVSIQGGLTVDRDDIDVPTDERTSPDEKEPEEKSEPTKDELAEETTPVEPVKPVTPEKADEAKKSPEVTEEKPESVKTVYSLEDLLTAYKEKNITPEEANDQPEQTKPLDFSADITVADSAPSKMKDIFASIVDDEPQPVAPYSIEPEEEIDDEDEPEIFAP